MTTVATYERRPCGRVAVVVAVIGLALGACGGGSNDGEQPDASTTTGAEASTYVTNAFVLPFELDVPACSRRRARHTSTRSRRSRGSRSSSVACRASPGRSSPPSWTPGRSELLGSRPDLLELVSPLFGLGAIMLAKRPGGLIEQLRSFHPSRLVVVEPRPDAPVAVANG